MPLPPRSVLKTILNLLALSLAVAIVVTAVRIYLSEYRRERLAREIHAMNEVRMWLSIYAGDHDGNFPPSFPESAPEGMEPIVRRFHEIEATYHHQWAYHPGAHLSDSPHSLVLATRDAVAFGHPLIFFSDGSMDFVDRRK